MKKNILILAATFFSTLLFSQEIADKTIGLRLGDDDGLGAEISFQKSMASNNRIELGLAWRNANKYNAYKLTGTYQWLFELDQNFNWYAGAGGGFGSWKLKDDNEGDDGFFLFASGVVGIEYAFDFPLLLSLDVRPELGFAKFNDDLGLDFALGVRYIIK